MTTWLFGYGSLVSPESLASTIGRTTVPGVDMHLAALAGWGRRWNYGSKVLRGDWVDDTGTEVTGGLVVSLGVVAAADESINGVVFSVDDVELADLDWRERDYDRVAVGAAVEFLRPATAPTSPVPVELYVPRPSSVERYEQHRDRGMAAIRQSYHELVDAAFATWGDEHVSWYRRTPAPDIPVADIRLDPLPSVRPSQH